ncbi:MAG: hypothetical protein ABIP44_10595, partial [Pseudoxanthomonas sp.]
GEHAFYFEGYAASDLAEAIRQWLQLKEQGQAPTSVGMPRQSWKQSAQALMRLVLDGDWDCSWRPNPRYWFPVTDERLQRQVGTLEHRALSTDGRGGYLIYGPYVNLPAGHYRVRVLGQWQGTQESSSTLDIVTGQGQQTILHAMLALEAAVNGCLLEDSFLLAADVVDMEMRLWVDAATRLRVTGIELLGQSARSDSPDDLVADVSGAHS